MSEESVQQDEFCVPEHVRSALNLTSVGLLVIDRDRIVRGANAAARHLLRLPSDALGRDVLEFLPVMRRLFDRPSGGHEQEFLLYFPTTPQTEVSVHAARPDEQGCRVILCREIAAHGSESIRHGETDALMRLDNFMSRLSHEVRNPLASILAGLQALERSNSLTSDDLFIVGLVIGEARSAVRIIEKFTETVRCRSFSVNRVPVGQFVETCVAELNEAVHKKGVSLELIPGSSDAWIAVDERAMKRALRSLLQNALDACERGDAIEVGWRILAEEERGTLFPSFLGQVVVMFGTDTGCGLPRHLPQSALFEPLVTTKPSAAGLGLPVARHIVENQGGVLSLHAGPSAGTTFEIFLPLGARTDCWEVMRAHRSPSDDEDPCRTCDVRIGKTGELCWATKGRPAVPGQESDAKACAKCAFYGTFNLVSAYKPPVRP